MHTIRVCNSAEYFATYTTVLLTMLSYFFIAFTWHSRCHDIAARLCVVRANCRTSGRYVLNVCCWGQFIVRKSSVLQIQTIRLTRDHMLFIFCLRLNINLTICFSVQRFFYLVFLRTSLFWTRKKKNNPSFPLPPHLHYWEWEINI